MRQASTQRPAGLLSIFPPAQCRCGRRGRQNRSVPRWTAVAAAVISCALAAPPAIAGLGPENVVVVVNGGSVDSLTLANHYVQLRGIPTNNVVVLDGIPDGLSVSLETFRETILKPLLAELDRRKLSPHTRVIAYSADFPTSVNIQEHTKRLTDEALKKYQKPLASLNSMTFFYRYVLADSEAYLGWMSNHYARGPFKRHFLNPFPGGEKKQAFEDAQEAMKDERFEEAAEGFSSLAESFPLLTPVRILAAEAWIQAGRRPQAIEQLGHAVARGWQNRRYLTEQSPLKVLFENRREVTAEAPSIEAGKQRENEKPDDGGELAEADPSARQDGPTEQDATAGTERDSALLGLLEGMVDLPTTTQEPVPFHATVGWTPTGHRAAIDTGAVSFMLSCSLAVLHPRGSTMEQAVDHLSRSATADRTYPDGVVGFAKTKNVRSTTRMQGYNEAKLLMLALHRAAETFDGNLPGDARRYTGLILGSANVPVREPRWSLAPGALVDNLTSLGGNYRTDSQTKLTEFLHAGAAMSSGTVAEPYAIPMKFPAPAMHAFYAQGLSAIEAFYLSVFSPYQLLIVGDPLTQPFARPPNSQIVFSKLQPGETLLRSDQTSPQSVQPGQHVIRFTREAIESPPEQEREREREKEGVHPTEIEAHEIYLQDRFVTAQPGGGHQSDIRVPENFRGELRCRVVLQGEDIAGSRIGFEEAFQIGPTEHLPRIRQLSARQGGQEADRPEQANDDAASGDRASGDAAGGSDKGESDDAPARLRLEVTAKGADQIELRHFNRVVGTIAGDRGTLTLQSAEIGHGPVRLQAVSRRDGQPTFGPQTDLTFPAPSS